uniref:FXYD domain-containing ion transport regulator n=1 Tax=Pelusios castaneus TaxID=367368 RepID=A0A8C8RXC1_9SAUR
MQLVATNLLLLLAGEKWGLPTADPDPLLPDWDGLRIGGLIVSGVLCTLGIIVLLSELVWMGLGTQWGEGQMRRRVSGVSVPWEAAGGLSALGRTLHCPLGGWVPSTL